MSPRSDYSQAVQDAAQNKYEAQQMAAALASGHQIVTGQGILKDTYNWPELGEDEAEAWCEIELVPQAEVDAAMACAELGVRDQSNQLAYPWDALSACARCQYVEWGRLSEPDKASVRARWDTFCRTSIGMTVAEKWAHCQAHYPASTFGRQVPSFDSQPPSEIDRLRLLWLSEQAAE